MRLSKSALIGRVIVEWPLAAQREQERPVLDLRQRWNKSCRRQRHQCSAALPSQPFILDANGLHGKLDAEA